MTLPAVQRVTFTAELTAERKGVARIRAFTQAVFQMMFQQTRPRCSQRLVSSQKLL